MSNPDFELWKRSNTLLRGWIMGTLSEEVITYVVRLETLWNTLKMLLFKHRMKES